MVRALALLLIAYLPGALAFRAPWGGRDRRAGLDAGERLFWAVVTSLACSLAGVLVLAALGQYRLERLLVLNAALCALVAAGARGRLRLGAAARPWRPADAVPLALVAAGLWLYFPASEFVVGGKDPGVYVNEGIQIAQRGALVVDDPVVGAVPAALADLFFPPYGQAEYHSLRFMGFFVREAGAPAVVPQFPHLFPASMALGYGVNGLSGARQTVGAWAILGVLATYFVGARLFGRPVAAAAAALLAVNVVLAWFARYPNAEVAMLTLLWAGLLALARATTEEDRYFAVVAGLLLSMLLLLRIDTVLALGAAGAGIAAGWLTGRGPGWRFYAMLAAGLAVTAVYLLTVMRAYIALPLVWAAHLNPATVALAVLGCFALALAAWGLRAAREPLVRWGPIALGAVLALLAVYAWFFREPAGKLAAHDAMALRSFGWYVTPPVVALAVAGLLVRVRGTFWRAPAWFLTVAVYAVFFFYKIRIVPEHFWAARRFLAVILPAALLLAVAGVAWVVETAARRGEAAPAGGPPAAARALLLFVLVAPIGVQFWQASAPVFAHVEYAGIIPQLERLAERFTERDLVIVESRNASDAHVLALPLNYIYARPALVLASPAPDRAAFAAFLDTAAATYERVFFLGGGGTDLLSRRLRVEPVASERFQVPEYESRWNAYPRGVRQKEFDFGLYRFVAGTGGEVAPLRLTLGEGDDLHVVRFHAKERFADGSPFRWTRDVSYVAVTGITPTARAIALTMAGGARPANAPVPVVTVSIDGRVLGAVTLGPNRSTHEFAMPADLVAALAESEAPGRLRIDTPTWNPLQLSGAADARDLGVMVFRVEVR